MNLMIITNNVDKTVESLLNETTNMEKFVFDNTAEDLKQVINLHKTTIPCLVIIRNLKSDSILAVAENDRKDFHLVAVNLRLPDNLALQSRFKIENRYDDYSNYAQQYLTTKTALPEYNNLTFFISLADYIKDYNKLKKLQHLINYIQAAQTNILWQDIFRRLKEIV